MSTSQTVAFRIRELCEKRGITPNALSYMAAVPQSTVKSILNYESKNPGIVTIKKLCDGLDITLKDFFDSELFKNLDQEIK
jgi:transcriptional regulator with XRE-family HTH domain